MIAYVLAPIFLFLVGFFFGYVMSRIVNPDVSGWLFKVFVTAIVWLPIVSLLVLQYTEVIAPDTLSLLFTGVPRVIKYPVLGWLIGYSLETVLALTRPRRVR